MLHLEPGPWLIVFELIVHGVSFLVSAETQVPRNLAGTVSAACDAWVSIAIDMATIARSLRNFVRPCDFSKACGVVPIGTRPGLTVRGVTISPPGRGHRFRGPGARKSVVAGLNRPSVRFVRIGTFPGLCRRSERGRRAHSGREAQWPVRDRHATLGQT